MPHRWFRPFLKRCHINYVVNLARRVPNFYAGRWNGLHDITYRKFAVSDSEDFDLLPMLPRIAAAIEEGHSSAERTVLVHCRQGSSRSAAAIAAWLMQHRGLSLAQADTFLLWPEGGFVVAFLRVGGLLFAGLC